MDVLAVARHPHPLPATHSTFVVHSVELWTASCFAGWEALASSNLMPADCQPVAFGARLRFLQPKPQRHTKRLLEIRRGCSPWGLPMEAVFFCFELRRNSGWKGGQLGSQIGSKRSPRKTKQGASGYLGTRTRPLAVRYVQVFSPPPENRCREKKKRAFLKGNTGKSYIALG